MSTMLTSVDKLLKVPSALLRSVISEHNMTISKVVSWPSHRSNLRIHLEVCT